MKIRVSELKKTIKELGRKNPKIYVANSADGKRTRVTDCEVAEDGALILWMGFTDDDVEA